MTIHLPAELERFILTKIRSGQFADEQDAVAAAVRRWRDSEHDSASSQASAAPARPSELSQPAGERSPEAIDTTAQAESMELQSRLFAAGLLSEIKPPITDLTPYRNRQAVPIQGEPLSETVIRDRR